MELVLNPNDLTGRLSLIFFIALQLMNDYSIKQNELFML